MVEIRFKRPMTAGTIAVLFVVGSLLYVLNTPMNTLIVKATNSAINPVERSLARWTLFTFRGKSAEIEELQQSNGINFTFSDPSGRGYDVLEWLIDKGADVNISSPLDGMTAAHSAVLLDRPDCLKLLIERGANLSIKDTKRAYTVCELYTLLRDGKTATAQKLFDDLLQCGGVE